MHRYTNIKALNTVIIIFFFILPYTIVASLNTSDRTLFYSILILFYIGLTFYLLKDLSKRKYTNALHFALIFILTGILNQLINGYISFYNIISPFVAYLGYIFTIKYRFDRRLFSLLMIGNYVYFIIIYYSFNSLDFFIPETQMNTQYFINTSTNLIPAVLIINLYVYDIFNNLKFNRKSDKIILLFAVINVILILLQRGRAGIFVSVIFLLLKLREVNKKLFIFSTFIFLVFLIQNTIIVNLYLETTGGMTNVTDYSEDARGIVLRLFFENLDLKSFFFGYGTNIFSLGNVFSTQSLFLNIWNYYGLFTLIFTLFIIIKKFLKNSKNLIHASYLIPFLAYSLFEGFFLPNFWDFAIYLILFYETGNLITRRHSKRKNDIETNKT